MLLESLNIPLTIQIALKIKWEHGIKLLHILGKHTRNKFAQTGAKKKKKIRISMTDDLFVSIFFPYQITSKLPFCRFANKSSHDHILLYS